MDNQRLLIWAFFGLMLWLTFQAWQQDYGPKPTPAAPAAETPEPAATATPEELPPADLPELSVPSSAANAPAATEPESGTGTAPAAPRIHVTTDVLDVEISLTGGTLVRAALPGYPVAKDQPDVPVVLLDPGTENFGQIRTGLRPAPGHDATFTASRTSFAMGDDDVLVVPLTWTDGQGLSVEKRFRFKRGSYTIEVEQTLHNGTATAWRGDQYAQLIRRFHTRKRSMFDVASYSFDGPKIFDGDSAEKLKHDDLLKDGPHDFKTDHGWVAAIQHHFLSAVVPDAGKEHAFRVQEAHERMTASVVGLKRSIEPGASDTFTETLFIGPKLQKQLAAVDPKLPLTVDYGPLTILSHPLFLLLSMVHTLVHNWGIAIILVTALIKLAFYKLTQASGRSMAKMRNLQPRLKALQERYKDDKQALSQAMMELYKREKVNPAAGCLPILIQMPFFLAFYWVLVESVEMRQAPFAFWITDLSSRDPYFILPLIMGAAMFFQQRLNPQVGDPVQMKVMQVMPLIFTVFFAFFPSGLVLYWVTNTLLSIAQQWRINKVVTEEGKRHPGGKKKASD
ncbi:MAG: membrane protein insertase YidC [Woeseiaceae bacterium]